MHPDDRPTPTLQPWARFLIAASLLLAISLLAAATLPLSAPATPLGPVEVEASSAEGEDEEEVEWESDEEWEEEDEEEEYEANTPGSAVVLPVQCLLRTAVPNVVAGLAQESVRLTLRYTATSPTRVGVDFWLKGGKGTLELGSDTRHLATQGVLHLSSHLDPREIAKVRAARVFMVQLDVPEAPPSCAHYLTLRLSSKHLARERATWSVPLERRR